MSSVITTDFEKWKAQQVAAGQPVVLDEFVFANVPDLDPTQTISRDEKLPVESQIVHRQAVNKTGLASENAVAYSVTLGTEVGHFDFNWIGLINKASGVIGMITHAPTQKKIKTANGLQGNVLTRSFLLEFEGAATETAIITTAETWQIDFTARLTGMDEMQRLINTDSYGEAAFFDDGFAVVRQGEQYLVKKGLAYVGGLRGMLEFDQTLNSLRNTRVYADFSYQGNLVSQWQTVVKMTATNELSNYVDAAGYPHYVFAVAQIDSNGNVADLRRKGSLNDRDIAALNGELNRVKQDYATNPALNTVNENANSRLEKKQNGADIPNIQEFVNNLGLTKTVELAIHALDKRSGGTVTGDVEVTGTLRAEGAVHAGKIALATWGDISGGIWGDYLSKYLERKYSDIAKNGADIPDKNVFINNLGLRGTVELANNALDKRTGGTVSGAVTVGQLMTPALTVGSGGVYEGSRDAASFEGNNIEIRSWYGVGFKSTHNNPNDVASLYVDTRSGDIVTRGNVLAQKSVHAGEAAFAPWGDISGSVWGGFLSKFLERNYAKKNSGEIVNRGWVRDESTGLIMQWGTESSSGRNFNFPRMFSESCFVVLVTNADAQGHRIDNAFGYPVNNAEFYAATKREDGIVNSFPVTWLAIGR
ncbi:NgrE [Xenorhabdus stockiae]|uniref:NgrE n=1 Tax=Xenorhabdus stockiae TaxID=351614 RepID=A0A2D0KM98_9GAMM|nr:phage tail protein [Xenorhabdus stockiae]PHM64435.1 NgrE [Xenorhabdus stockiae]